MAALFRRGLDRESLARRLGEARRFVAAGLDRESLARRLKGARRLVTAELLTLGIVALVWIPLARAIFPLGTPPDWYEALAGGRAGVYSAVYPTLHLIFVFLCPIFVLAAGIRLAMSRALPQGAVQSRSGGTTPSALRARVQTHLPAESPEAVLFTPRARLRRALAVQLGVVSILLVTYPALSGTNDRIGLVLGIAACALALLVWRSDSTWGLSVLGLFAAAQAATFAVVLREALLPFEYRPLLVLTTILYGAIPVYLIGMLLPKPKAGALIALTISLMSGALAVETVGSWLLARQGGITVSSRVTSDADYVVRYDGPQEEHPEIGPIPVPNSVTETLYPDDPRGYFRIRNRLWSLGTQASSDARMELTSDGVGVLIDRADDPAPFHIFAERRGLALVEGTEYLLRFRVRATQERRYRSAVTMAHPPGEALGLAFDAAAGPEWTSVERPFTASLSEDSARVDLRLGGDTADVYVSDMIVTRAEDGVRVDEGSGFERYVSYEWNSHGCRAPEYPTPPAPGTFRVLALGDSYTMGQGVHSEDVFTSVMDRLLQGPAAAAPNPRPVEVVNCGVSGFSTREERLYYEERASAYQPDLVLVVMVADDDRTFTDDELLGFVHRPARWEYLLHAGYLMQSARHTRPEPDFSASMAKLAALNERVREDGAELAVVVFTNGVGPAWDRLSARAGSTAQALGIPILDLRDQLLTDNVSAQLRVHPIDGHPNEIAHRLAAEEIVEWLERDGLIEPPL